MKVFLRLTHKFSVAVQTVRASVTRQVILREVSSGEWPTGCVLPPVLTHNKYSNRRFLHYSGVSFFEPIIEPSQFVAGEIDHGGRTEVDRAQLRAAVHSVGPRTHQKFLALADSFRPFCGHADVIHGRAGLLVVIPAGDV